MHTHTMPTSTMICFQISLIIKIMKALFVCSNEITKTAEHMATQKQQIVWLLR